MNDHIDVVCFFLQPHSTTGGTGTGRHPWLAKDLSPKENANFKWGLGLKENAQDGFDKSKFLNQLGQDALSRFFRWKKLKVFYFMTNTEEI